MSANKPKLGYIGVGLMGRPMILRLIAAGYQVTVWNRSVAKLEAVVGAGAEAASSPAAVAEASDVVFACLTDTAAVDAVVFGADGIVARPGVGKIFVDHSSIRPDRTREMAERLAAANGMAWIDAPVSGGTRGAEQGSLAIMAGGAPAQFERVQPIVAHTASRFTLMGPVGAGQITKLCNQVIVGGAFATIAEAVRLATNAGVDGSRLTEALAGGFADSLPFQIFVPRMLAAGQEPLGHTATMLKDLDTALDLGRSTDAPMPMAATVAEIFRLMVAQGHGQSEPSVLYSLYGKA